MARAALKELSLDRILFVPTGAPRYRQPAVAAPEHRLAMLRLAIEGEPRFQIDERELAPGASAYTVDTLRALRTELGDVNLYLLIGADQYEKLTTWHRPDEVKRLAKIVVFGRPSIPLKGEADFVPMHMPVSATDVRKRAARGEDLSGLMPPAVARYIAAKGLYA